MEEKESKFKNRNYFEALRNAWNGCWYSFTTQNNFIIHLILSLLVMLLALWLKVSYERFLFLVLAVFLGLTVEMVNTMVEKLVDLITQEYHVNAKIVKDISAGIMLVLSCGMAVIGFLILFPPLWRKLF